MYNYVYNLWSEVIGYNITCLYVTPLYPSALLANIRPFRPSLWWEQFVQPYHMWWCFINNCCRNAINNVCTWKEMPQIITITLSQINIWKTSTDKTPINSQYVCLIFKTHKKQYHSLLVTSREYSWTHFDVWQL